MLQTLIWGQHPSFGSQALAQKLAKVNRTIGSDPPPSRESAAHAMDVPPTGKRVAVTFDCSIDLDTQLLQESASNEKDDTPMSRRVAVSFDCTIGLDPQPLPESTSNEPHVTPMGKRVALKSNASIYSVVPYAEIYGVHPNSFDFNRDGSILNRKAKRSCLEPAAVANENIDPAAGVEFRLGPFIFQPPNSCVPLLPGITCVLRMFMRWAVSSITILSQSQIYVAS